jgi:hypothetical protein
MTAPVRVQRHRTKGWRMPPNTIYVGRPTRFGNPFKVVCLYDYRRRGRGACWGVLESVKLGDTDQSICGFTETHDNIADARSRAVELFCEAISAGRLAIDIAPLRGKNLACFCPLDQRCHADILLARANASEAA